MWEGQLSVSALCRSERAREKLTGAAFIQDTRVIVDVFREQARSYRTGTLPHWIWFLLGKPGYLPGVRVNLVLPYTFSKFCGCIGKLRYCALSAGSMPLA